MVALLLFFKTEDHENKDDGAETMRKVIMNAGTWRMLLFVNKCCKSCYLTASIMNYHGETCKSWGYLDT